MAKKINPNFATPELVDAICEKMQTVERIRAQDRAWIDALANGGRPYTSEEVEKHQIQINVNWGGLRKIIQTANSQVNNALIYKARLFNAVCQGGKIEKRQEYSEAFTLNANRCLRRKAFGKRHSNLLKSRNAAVTLHGIGPVMWMKKGAVLARFIPLENLLIPTDTLIDFSDLGHFCVNVDLTQSEFFDMTHGEKVDKRWNVEACNKILDDLSASQDNKSSFTFANEPEKQVEHFKQNRCYYDSDAVSTVKLRFFFYKHHESGKWYRFVLLREGTASQPAKKDFLFDGSDIPWADEISHILHVQFGDNNLCSPLKYHSVRGLGAILYSPEECNNRILCETVQHTLLNLKTFFKQINPVDRDRPKILDLSQYSVVPDGMSIVPQTERHQIDPRLIEYVQSQLRQVMSEGSTSYTQDIQSSSSVQPETATKTNALVQTANIQVSAMLQSLYEQETSYYEEIIRRLLDKNTDDEVAKKFQEKCKQDGIPPELMTVDNWEVNPERVLGGGDQFIAAQEANALLSQSQRYDPSSQRSILRQWTMTTTRNPALSEMLVPADPNEATPGTIAAEDVFGTLMQGIVASIREGIDRSSYVESLLGMQLSKIQQIKSIDDMGTRQELIGLKTVTDHIGRNIDILATDPNMQQQVKVYGDMLGKQANEIRAFEQRQAEAAQQNAQQSGVDPKVMAAIQGEIIKAQSKAQIAQSNNEIKQQINISKERLKQQQKQVAFNLDEARKNMATMAELKRGDLKARQELINQNLQAALDALNKTNPPENPNAPLTE